ncbi:hypothetical protein BAUCODRAFT_294055 [Baudoinia panamericana UAMH 10762]|uniref:Uncharacterized protein n=1 Tax=Baudoinia panamericana (strain UAMH 10762) TaxID=717646 RepID=M2N0T7_BAUPA|nr:uncharacterized protein BAUCODRAFT_294055 [Baudoinia panamericana UAMH 10762]EMC92509.1 hypothetical protein BAUCODRAFT_294055 [Baudoinia panamericana UAMH 10762]
MTGEEREMALTSTQSLMEDLFGHGNRVWQAEAAGAFRNARSLSHPLRFLPRSSALAIGPYMYHLSAERVFMGVAGAATNVTCLLTVSEVQADVSVLICRAVSAYFVRSQPTAGCIRGLEVADRAYEVPEAGASRQDDNKILPHSTPTALLSIAYY